MSTENFLDQKHVLIIGGTSGFGLEIAKLAAARGAKLTLIGRDATKAKAVAQGFKDKGVSAEGYGLDAADSSALLALLSTLKPIDHAVSMAGGAMGGGFISADASEIRRAIEEKFFANMLISRTIAPFIEAHGTLTLTAGSGGRAHNASGAIVGNQAIATLVQGLAVELAPKLRVNAVAPTWTVTPLWRNVDQASMDQTKAYFEKTIPLGRTAEPKEVALAYLFLMQCGFITGQTLAIDGGLTLVA